MGGTETRRKSLGAGSGSGGWVGQRLSRGRRVFLSPKTEPICKCNLEQHVLGRDGEGEREKSSRAGELNGRFDMIVTYYHIEQFLQPTNRGQISIEHSIIIIIEPRGSLPAYRSPHRRSSLPAKPLTCTTRGRPSNDSFTKLLLLLLLLSLRP